MKELKKEKKTEIISIRVKKSVMRFLKKNKYSPTLIFDESVKKLMVIGGKGNGKR